MGGPPVVVKLLEGTQGIGVILAELDAGGRGDHGDARGPGKMSVLLQQFVKESRGRDVRAFVVGNRVVAAMRRIARDGEFRSNVHRGGSAEEIALEPEYERVADARGPGDGPARRGRRHARGPRRTRADRGERVAGARGRSRPPPKIDVAGEIVRH